MRSAHGVLPTRPQRARAEIVLDRKTGRPPGGSNPRWERAEGPTRRQGAYGVEAWLDGGGPLSLWRWSLRARRWPLDQAWRLTDGSGTARAVRPPRPPFSPAQDAKPIRTVPAPPSSAHRPTRWRNKPLLRPSRN